MNFREIEQGILNHRGDKSYMEGVIMSMQPLKEKYDWQMNKFLSKYITGIEGLKKLELDNSNPLYRYYQHKCEQYAAVERIIRVAKAFA